MTNNRSDFLVLHGQEALHAGVIIIVPNVTPVCGPAKLRNIWIL